jgi:hypothetical protein
VSHASSVIRPPILTSSPPQSSSVADAAPQDTRGPLAASPFPHTKPITHVLTQKLYVANQNNICPIPPQEDIADGSFSITSGPYRARGASRPMFHCRIA